MIPPNASLVKYDNPVLVSRNTDKKTPRAKALKASPTPPTAAGPLPVPPKGKGTPMDAKAAQQTDEILNSILPPREWTESGQLWVQQVSSTPATRLDVVNLQEELDRRLQQRQARETGICPVRRELYSQCFDELIRQVTINCAERGLLLLRVRDEIRMTIAAYQTLYESSVAFGMRKALQAEQGKADMEKKITELESEKRDLERQVNELKAKCEQTEKRAAELRQVEEKKHTEEIQFLKRTNQQLKESLLNKAGKQADSTRGHHRTQEIKDHDDVDGVNDDENIEEEDGDVDNECGGNERKKSASFRGSAKSGQSGWQSKRNSIKMDWTDEDEDDSNNDDDEIEDRNNKKYRGSARSSVYEY